MLKIKVAPKVLYFWKLVDAIKFGFVLFTKSQVPCHVEINQINQINQIIKLNKMANLKPEFSFN